MSKRQLIGQSDVCETQKKHKVGNKEEKFDLCKEHEHDLSLKCIDDQKIICPVGHCVDHEDHRVVHLIDDHQRNIEDLVRSLRKSKIEQKLVLEKSQNTLTQLENARKEYMDKFDDMIREVTNHVSHVQENIECCDKEIQELVEKEKNVRQSRRVKKEEAESIQNAVSGRNDKTFPFRYFEYQQPSAPKKQCGKLEDKKMEYKKVSVPKLQVTPTIEVPDYEEGNVSFRLHLVLSIQKKRARRESYLFLLLCVEYVKVYLFQF